MIFGSLNKGDSMLKKSLTLAVVAVTAVGLTACNERQVATGAAIAGGALIAGAVADSYNRNRYDYGDRYRPGYYNDGYGYGNSYGYQRRYDYRRRGLYWNSSEVQENGSQDSEAQVHLAATGRTAIRPEQALAQAYKMPVRAASKVLNVFENVKASGSLESLNAMGVGQNELQALANGAAPSAQTLSSVAQSLGATPASVHALFSDFSREYALAQSEQRL